MATNHTSARGVRIDMDRLRLSNETTIAVGNMKVNARGDQLGPGGKIIKTRSQILAEKNKLHHGPLADEFDVFETADNIEPVIEPVAQVELLQPSAEDTPVAESSEPAGYVKPRGSLADSIAQQTEVKQELLDPSIVLGKKTSGPQRL